VAAIPPLLAAKLHAPGRARRTVRARWSSPPAARVPIPLRANHSANLRHGRLSKLAVPVLLAVGGEDESCLEPNLFLKRTIPRAGLWMAPGTGHAINVEAPAAFNQVVQDSFGPVERGGWGPPDRHGVPKRRSRCLAGTLYQIPCYQVIVSLPSCIS